MGPPGQPRSRRSGRLGFWGVPPFLALFESEALAVHFQDVDMVGQAIQQGSGQAFGTEDFRPFIERQIGGDDHRASLVALRDGFEQKFGAGFGQRHEAELIDDQQMLAGELFLQAQKTPLIARFHQFMNQGGGGDKANLQALLAGRQAETKGNMGFAGAGGDVPVDVEKLR